MDNPAGKKATTNSSAAKKTVKAPPRPRVATKFATAAAIDPLAVYMEEVPQVDEQAETIKRLQEEIAQVKADALTMQKTMNAKMNLFVKIQFGAMSLLGAFNLFD